MVALFYNKKRTQCLTKVLCKPLNFCLFVSKDKLFLILRLTCQLALDGI